MITLARMEIRYEEEIRLNVCVFVFSGEKSVEEGALEDRGRDDWTQLHQRNLQNHRRLSEEPR